MSDDWLIRAARRPVGECTHDFGTSMFCRHCGRSAQDVYNASVLHVAVDPASRDAVVVTEVRDGRIVRITQGGTFPDELFLRNGRPHFKCRVCGQSTEWDGEIEDFDPMNPANVCGGSPRCCP